MAEKVRLKISSAVAAYVNPGVSGEEKLSGISRAATMSVVDQITLLSCLMRDADEVVRLAASAAFSALPFELLLEYAALPVPHPLLLDGIARVHYARPEIAAALLGCEALSSQARTFLERFNSVAGLTVDAGGTEQSCGTEEAAGSRCPDDDGSLSDASQVEGDDSELGVCEENEEYLSKYKMAQVMGIAEKIKMALTGDKEWRAILIKDANKLVSGGVIKNPRITEAEIITILRVGVQNDEIIRLICANKEWIKNYKIRKALVDNPKTPLPHALRYLATLGEKDVAGYAKSKNISSVLSTQAKRMLLNKKR